MTPAGFPHSDIPGSKPVCGSPRLIAAYHVLRRLLVPRHPPCALSSLTGIFTKVLPLCLPSVSYSIVKELARRASAASDRPRACRQRSLSAPPHHFRRSPLSYLVEIAGLEPAASGLQSRRSPSCAISPQPIGS